MNREINIRRLLGAVCTAILACLVLLVGSLLLDSRHYFWFMPWNLFLALVPLLLSTWLCEILHKHLWSSWRALVVTVLWLLFLPNSFYVVSDFVHIKNVPANQLMYQIAMLAACAIVSFGFGIVSLGQVHVQLLRRVRALPAAVIMTKIILLSSFATYLGRDLRWNSWDVFINIPSLLFDVSDRLLHPTMHPLMISITSGFFLLTAGCYAAYWRFVSLTRP
jgi:uncharacterized membrane protein